MSFRHIPREPFEAIKRFPYKDDEIVLQWKGYRWNYQPDAQSLMIHIGGRVADLMGITYTSTRVQLWIGEGEDSGFAALLPAARGEFHARSRGGNWHKTVYLTSQVSLEHFALAPAVKIGFDRLKVVDRTLYFPIPAKPA